MNHVEADITKVYDRYICDKEKQEALNAWGARLSRIVSGLELVKAEYRERWNSILFEVECRVTMADIFNFPEMVEVL